MTQLAQNTEIGENIASATITGMTRGADGTLTPGTSHSLLPVLENINETGETETDRASITASPSKNSTGIESGTDLEITGFILRNDFVATPLNWARNTWDNFRYAEVVWEIANITSTYVGLVKSFKQTMNGKTHVKFEMTLEHVDIGGTNPVRS